MIDRKKFESLSQISGQHCISFFIPTHRAGEEQEDRIRYKNMLNEVKNELLNRELPEKATKQMLAKATDRIDDLEFWQQQSDGLAVFIYNGKTSFHELPIHFHPFSFVGKHLYLKPIVPLLSRDAKFFLLAISQNATRFFVGERYAITPVKTHESLPNGIGELTKYFDGEKHLQHHSGQGNEGEPIFHGQGHAKEMDEVRRKEYLRMINKGVVEDLMCKDDTEPLILATVEENAAIYHQVNTYQNLHPEFIPGNPENDDPVLLHEKAWELMRPQVERTLQDKIQAFDPALAEEEASFSLHDIIPAAVGGRIKNLFLAEEDERWGSYNEKDHSITIHEERRENSVPLLHLAAVNTIKNGGTVHLLPRTELPRPTASANAIFRYANVPA